MEKKSRRGNQGWSTAGRAGRKPLPPDQKRKNRSLKATDEEWEKIKEFSRKLKKGEIKMANYVKTDMAQYEAAVDLMDDDIREGRPE